MSARNRPAAKAHRRAIREVDAMLAADAQEERRTVLFLGWVIPALGHNWRLAPNRVARRGRVTHSRRRTVA